MDRLIWNRLTQLGKINVTPFLCLLLAGYFFYAFSVAVGTPPEPSLNFASAFYLALAVLFFFLPEAERFKLGQSRELKSQLQDSRDEALLLRSQIATLMAAYNALLFTAGNSAQRPPQPASLPGAQQALAARQKLDTALGRVADEAELEAEIEAFLREEDFHLDHALWDLRRVIDQELGRILRSSAAFARDSQATPDGEDTSESRHLAIPIGAAPVERRAHGIPMGEPLAISIAAAPNFAVAPHDAPRERTLSSAALFEQFAGMYPQYSAMGDAFHYVLQLCEAALQGREVPGASAQQAFHMGFRILGILRQVEVRSQDMAVSAA